MMSAPEVALEFVEQLRESRASAQPTIDGYGLTVHDSNPPAKKGRDLGRPPRETSPMPEGKELCVLEKELPLFGIEERKAGQNDTYKN